MVTGRAKGAGQYHKENAIPVQLCSVKNYREGVFVHKKPS